MPEALPSTDGRRIETARLVLRRAALADLDALHAMLSDPVCMRFWSTAPHRARAETRAWLEQMIGSDAGDDFIVTRDGMPIGKFGMWRRPEVGFIFDRRFWGQGYATEAGAAFLGYAGTRGLDALTADVDPLNAGSLRLLERLGFHETGRAAKTVLVDGRWCDSVYFRYDRPGSETPGSA